jgi:hypothetical protein
MKATGSKTSYNLIPAIEQDHFLYEIDQRPYACMQVCAVVLNDGPEGPVEKLSGVSVKQVGSTLPYVQVCTKNSRKKL